MRQLQLQLQQEQKQQLQLEDAAAVPETASEEQAAVAAPLLSRPEHDRWHHAHVVLLPLLVA